MCSRSRSVATDDADVHLWPEKAGRQVSVAAVSTVAVDLAADFAARPAGAVNVYVGGAGTNRGEQFVEFARADATFICQVRHVYCGDGA